MKTASMFRAGKNIVFGDEALKTLFATRQVSPLANEQGGVLIGRLLHSGHIIVDLATIPQPNDRATPTTFFRSDDHQKIIDAEWAQSDGTSLYLGEWHTHAEAEPVPSVVDLNDWARRLKDDQPSIKTMLFVIVGTFELTIFEGSVRSLQSVRLESIRWVDCAVLSSAA